MSYVYRGNNGQYRAQNIRYCDCPAYRRDPQCLEQCLFCWRRIHPDHDHEINHIRQGLEG